MTYATNGSTTETSHVASSDRSDRRPAASLGELVQNEGWLSLSDDGVVRCPLLVKGRLVGPPMVRADAITRAFAALDRGRGSADVPAGYAKVGGAQVLRHQEIDRRTMRATGRWIYTVMPAVDPKELVETDIDALTRELYSMPHESALEWLRVVRAALDRESAAVNRVRDLDRMTSEHPDAFGDAAFLAFPFLLAPEIAVESVDSELSHFGAKGTRLLDDWVEMPTQRTPGPVHVLGGDLVPDALMNEIHTKRALVRALPTRQLHITAGNSPLIPVLSLLRAVWTKSPCTLKLPSGAALPGSLIALVAATAAPNHPITKHLSMVYWQGGDEEIERILFLPNAYDRIVVWGSPDSVASVRERASFTKILCFNPRYSVSLVGREAFDARQAGKLDEVAARAVCDSMIENQKACIASLVHYVEGSVEDAERYAAAVGRVLARWDQRMTHPLLDRHRGQLKRLERGVLVDAQVTYQKVDGEFRSGVIVAPHEFAIKDHPMCRLVVVRPVSKLDDCLRFFHAGVATAGVYPEDRRRELRDRIAARGVSNIVPLGHGGSAAVGSAHDGMLVLSELVDWKNA
jgi:hypothetical protein